MEQKTSYSSQLPTTQAVTVGIQVQHSPEKKVTAREDL
jgi:hypothetical protein